MIRLDWLKEAAEAVITARYRTSFELRRIGVEIMATAPGGYHRSSFLLPWEQLENSPWNPLPNLVDRVNQNLGRQIAQHGEERGLVVIPTHS